MIIYFFIVSIFSQEKDLDNLNENIDKFKKYSNLINDEISKKDTWINAQFDKDKIKTENLRKYLNISSIIYCNGIEFILVDHITYSPYDSTPENRIIDVDEMYPVVVTLKKLGTRAVKPLIEILKTVDPEQSKEKNNDELKRELALECLIDIYEQGGFGKEMTKYRLQLEFENTKDEKQKQLLQKALESGVLKD